MAIARKQRIPACFSVALSQIERAAFAGLTLNVGLKQMTVGRRAVFLDRDGVINEDRGYVHRREDFAFLDSAVAGMRLLQDAGFVLVVVTNQAGIGRGYYGVEDFLRLTEHMKALLHEQGVVLGDVRFCPHHPTEALSAFKALCRCRKPAPGMILDAAHDLGVDLPRSFLVGDRATDIEAGRAAGLSGCVLLKGIWHEQVEETDADADHICADLVSASRWIIARASRR